jgi:hypothetical protein
MLSFRSGKLLAALATAALLTTIGCTTMVGAPSFTLLARDAAPSGANLQPLGDVVEESECMTMFLFLVVAGQQPTHESVLARLLENHNADALIDGELETTVYGVPGIFMQTRTVARGRPARVVGTGGVR